MASKIKMNQEILDLRTQIIFKDITIKSLQEKNKELERLVHMPVPMKKESKCSTKK